MKIISTLSGQLAKLRHQPRRFQYFIYAAFVFFIENL